MHTNQFLPLFTELIPKFKTKFEETKFVFRKLRLLFGIDVNHTVLLFKLTQVVFGFVSIHIEELLYVSHITVS